MISFYTCQHQCIALVSSLDLCMHTRTHTHTHTHTHIYITAYWSAVKVHTFTLVHRAILQGSYKTTTKQDYSPFKASDGRDPFPGQIHGITSGYAKNLPQTVPKTKEVRMHMCTQCFPQVRILRHVGPTYLLY